MKRHWTRNRGIANVWLSMVVVGVVTLGVMIISTKEQDIQDKAEPYHTGRHIGRVFTQAHYYVQDNQEEFTDQLVSEDLVPLTFAELKTAKYLSDGVWDETRAGQKITMGVVADPYGTPMTIAAVTPALVEKSDLLEILRGAQSTGVVRIYSFEETDTDFELDTSEALLTALLGETPGRGVLYLRADRSIYYDARKLYDRPQPGHPLLSEMNAPINFADGAGIKDLAKMDSQRVNVGNELVSETRTLISGELTTQGNATFEDVDILGGLIADSGEFNSVKTATAVLREMSVNNANLTSSVTAQEADFDDVTAATELVIQGRLDADEVNAQTVNAERTDAQEWNTTNADVNGLYGPTGSIDTADVGECYGCD